MPNAARKPALPTEVQFLRERVVALETRNAELTHELLALRREGWAGAEKEQSTPSTSTAPQLPPAVISAILQRAPFAAGGAQQLLNFAVTQLAAQVPEDDILHSIMEGVNEDA